LKMGSQSEFMPPRVGSGVFRWSYPIHLKWGENHDHKI